MTTLITVILPVVFAISDCLWCCPCYLASLLKGYTCTMQSLMAIIEGVLRITHFYYCMSAGISAMQDIKRLYRYHGAEHKCINCIEKGRPLTVHRRHAKLQTAQALRNQLHLLFVLLVQCYSVFFFIRVDNPAREADSENRTWCLSLREFPTKLSGWQAGRDNIVVRIISAPGMWMQTL